MATPDESSLIRCSICFNSKEGRRPRILSCVHSFCQECLKEWHEKRHREGHHTRTQAECPTCRTISALPSGDISDLPLDINVQQFADYVNKESNVCKTKKGKSACMMCFVFLCEECGENHKQLPLFSSHELTRNICELHGAALQGVCMTCLCGVCLTCVNEGLHRHHPLEDMSSGIKKIKSQVKNCTLKLREMLRQWNLEKDEKRKYIKQFQGKQDLKRTLDLIKKEVERLEKDTAEHEVLCDAKTDAIFKDYEAHSERAAVVIENGNQLFEENEEGILDKLKSTDVPDEEMCTLLRGFLSSIPDFNSISFSNCRIDNATDALEALKNCKLVCGIGDVKTTPHTPESPIQVFKKNCREAYNVENPWCLCGTPGGDVIICGISGGPVYKVYKDSTKTLLTDDGIAACVHGCDVYVISTDGSTMTQIKQDGSTVNHKLIPPIFKPKGLSVTDDNVFILSSNAITKQSMVDTDTRETFNINDCEDLGYLMKIRHNGMTKLVITDWNTQKVIVTDEFGAELTRLGLYGTDGLMEFPKGISSMSNRNLLVANRYGHNIVEYEMDGTFVRNLLTKRDGLLYPQSLVYKYPYLWILENDMNNLTSLKLFRF